MGRTIKTYLVEGTVFGVKTVEFTNRKIKGIFIPRKKYKELNGEELELLNFAGVYFLFGEDEEGNNMTYIGQAVNLKSRIDGHIINKDFWNIAVIFTYNDGTLTETDINFLEGELIKKAKELGRMKLENSTIGNKSKISQDRKDDMEEGIEDLKILLSNLGFDLLKEIIEKEAKANKYYSTVRGSKAEAIYTSEGMLVLKGSTGPKDLQDNVIKGKHYAYRNRPKFLDDGVIKEEGDKIIFVKDYLFPSVTSAIDIVSGGNFNGWDFWKNKDGKTLNEIERRIK